jgi:hypothetical protein
MFVLSITFSSGFAFDSFRAFVYDVDFVCISACLRLAICLPFSVIVVWTR